MSFTTLKRILLATLTASVLAATTAHADSRMVMQAKDYAAKNNLPIRKVMAPGSGKPVERIFVPVLPNTFADLSNRLVEGNGGIGIRAVIDHVGHVAVRIEQGTTYLWAKQQPGNYESLYMSHNSQGYLFGVDLSAEEITHFKTQMASIPSYPGNCMMWLADAQIAPNKLLFHELGVTRSRGAGDAIRQKLLRVANDRLQVAGVIVNTVDEFNAMTDAQLLGPAHPNGDAEAVHQ